MPKMIQYRMAILTVALSCLTIPSYAASSACAKSTAIGMAPCDVTFTTIPTFAAICLTQVEAGQYTITNNTPVTMKINYIRIKSNDTSPVSNTTIVTAPANNCGTSLAPGASCNILVSLQPTVVGALNRVLQVGINSRQVEIDAPAINFAVCATPPTPPPGAFFYSPILSVPSLDCTILGFSTVTNSGNSAINGNVCLTPGTSITGFPPGVIVNGTTHINDGTATTAQSNAVTIKTYVDGLPCTTILTGTDLGGLVLSPGTYCFATNAQLTGALTLNGAGYYYFKIGTTLTTANASSVVLTGGATAEQVFWDIGTSATLGIGTHFQGNILAGVSTTVTTGASVVGHILSPISGAITLDTNAVTP